MPGPGGPPPLPDPSLVAQIVKQRFETLLEDACRLVDSFTDSSQALNATEVEACITKTQQNLDDITTMRDNGDIPSPP